MARTPLARPTDAPPRRTTSRRGHASRHARWPTRDVDVLVDPADLPRHVAIIMDGNRRWARLHGRAELEGHAAGVEAIRALLAPRRPARRPGPDALRVQPRELGPLRRRGPRPVRPPRAGDPERDRRSCARQGVRIRLLGRLDELPEATRRSIDEALEATAGGDRLLLNVAFNYAGRTELVDAFRRAGRERHRRRRRSTRQAISRRALHGRPARPGPRDPDRRRAAALELPHLAVGLRRVLLLRGRSGRTSAPTPSTRRSSSSPGGTRRFGR